jgi:hypothetical protein
MRIRRGLLTLLLLLALAAQLSGADKRKFYLGQRPEQSIAVNAVPEIVAEQACQNFAFAAALETMLRMQGVETLDQRFWVGKITGDMTCRPLQSFELLQRTIEGDYVVGSNRRVRLTVQYTNAFPPVTDKLLVPLSQQRPYILARNGSIFLVTGATWHEMYFQTGQKIIEITRLVMIDPTASGDARGKDFTRDKDQVSELGGMFDVTVTPL